MYAFEHISAPHGLVPAMMLSTGQEAELSFGRVSGVCVCVCVCACACVRARACVYLGFGRVSGVCIFVRLL